DSCCFHRPGRLGGEPASRWPSLCTWPRSPREAAGPLALSPARRGGMAARTTTGPRLPCAEETRWLRSPAEWVSSPMLERSHLSNLRTVLRKPARRVVATLALALLSLLAARSADALTQTQSAAGTCTDATGIGTVAWSTPANAKTSNDVYTTAAFASSGDASHFLKCTGFGFSLPSTAL